jgi:hypothetical protein
MSVDGEHQSRSEIPNRLGGRIDTDRGELIVTWPSNLSTAAGLDAKLKT